MFVCVHLQRNLREREKKKISIDILPSEWCKMTIKMRTQELIEEREREKK